MPKKATRIETTEAKPPGLKKPKCESCGESTCHPYPNDWGGHRWLCGSCRYREEHPDAAPAVPMPRERRARPKQKETLFDATERAS